MKKFKLLAILGIIFFASSTIDAQVSFGISLGVPVRYYHREYAPQRVIREYRYDDRVYDDRVYYDSGYDDRSYYDRRHDNRRYKGWGHKGKGHKEWENEERCDD